MVKKSSRQLGGKVFLLRRSFWDGSRDSSCLVTSVFFHVFIFFWQGSLLVGGWYASDDALSTLATGAEGDPKLWEEICEELYHNLKSQSPRLVYFAVFFFFNVFHGDARIAFVSSLDECVGLSPCRH